ncbi:CYTH domain-containing protein [Thermodesulfobacteriota bacterium]
MPREIERKYLVKGDSWRKVGDPVQYRQGYLSTDKERVVRVRCMNNRAFLTIKGTPQGISRPEYEYEIPVDDAEEMLGLLCLRPFIEKKRYKLEYLGLTWEIDEFEGENDGLILAEVELENENQKVPLPEWIGDEVSHDSRYTNAGLVNHPYKTWEK